MKANDYERIKREKRPFMSKHQKTLEAVFATPIRAGILWSDIESLLLNKGAVITEGRGSRVRIALMGVKAVFHRPHPEKETNKGAVRDMREFLTKAGVLPKVGDTP